MGCSTTIASCPHRAAPAAGVGAALPTMVRFGRLLLAWADRAGQRRRLAELDDRLLRDIGLEPAAARREAAVPFWILRSDR